MNKFLIILILSIVACDLENDKMLYHQFQKFIKKYNKKYNSVQEFLARFEVFKKNTMESFKENASHKTGITKFSDLTQQEFSKNVLNQNYEAFSFANFNPRRAKIIKAAPDSFDWRERGYVTPVEDQGSCGANWAFAACAILETLYYRYKGVRITLSKQMLVDCDTYDSGCNGGTIEGAFTWIKANGIMKDSDYPYKGYKSTCKADKSKYIDMKVTGYKKLGQSSSTFSPVDEAEIKEFLYENGPLSAGINAVGLQSYTSGIIDIPSSQCPSSGINFFVTLVGYGHDSASNKDYWIAKNSWGKSWGESGYFRIKRGSGTCGINSYIITATVSF